MFITLHVLLRVQVIANTFYLNIMKIKKVNQITVQDWDDLVVKTYGKVYSFQQQNDTIPDEVNGAEMGVSFAAWLARDPTEWNGDPKDKKQWSIGLFWERNFYPNIQMIANDLHAKGLIKAGEYSIKIDW
jgi:hypothetical protein